jgi:hypothetical protein
MSTRVLVVGCLVGALAALAFRPQAARGAEPDLGVRVARVEEQAAQLQSAVATLKDTLARHATDAENLRLRMNTVEGYLQSLQQAFATLVPGSAPATPTAGAPVVPDGRVDQLEFLRDARNTEYVGLRLVSGRIANLPKRSRLELAVSITDADGLVRKTFEATSPVVESGEVVWLETRVELSTDGDQDKWFRELAGRDGKPDRTRVRNLVVKFQILSVLPPPK